MTSPPIPKKRAGIVGVPPLSIMKMLANPEFEIFDLDEPQGRIDIETSSPFLPRVYCGILRTVIANSLAVRPDIIYIDTGSGKMRLCCPHGNSTGRYITRLSNHQNQK